MFIDRTFESDLKNSPFSENLLSFQKLENEEQKVKTVFIDNEKAIFHRTITSSSRFSGSSKFCYLLNDKQLKLKQDEKSKNKLQANNFTDKQVLENYSLQQANENVNSEKIRTSYFDSITRNKLTYRSQEEKEADFLETDKFWKELLHKEKNTFKLNKSKVRRKIYAFSNVSESKKKLFFWTISFPLNMPDNLIFKSFNSWLTRMKRDLSLHSYLWISERQQNGTLHFHMIVNEYYNVVTANWFMRSIIYHALENEQKKQLEIYNRIYSSDLGYSDSAKKELYEKACKKIWSEDFKTIMNYNGVDIDKERRGKKGKRKVINFAFRAKTKALAKYLTKYITKNDSEFSHYCWHCSRDISALMTTFVVSSSDSELLKSIENEKTNFFINTDKFLVFFFQKTDLKDFLNELYEINELIYNSVLFI